MLRRVACGGSAPTGTARFSDGGIGYRASAFVALSFNGTPRWLIEALPIPAAPGEFWMVLNLLTVGLRPIENAVADHADAT